MTRRTDRLNSLLKEVISDVITKQVKNPSVSPLLTVTQVEVTKDLHHAKVYISVIGDDKTRNNTIDALESAAGYIAAIASKQVVMRYFPALTFKLDTTAEKHMRIETILHEIHQERTTRNNDE